VVGSAAQNRAVVIGIGQRLKNACPAAMLAGSAHRGSSGPCSNQWRTTSSSASSPRATWRITRPTSSVSSSCSSRP
jgi:hypothetical protein